MCALTTVHWKKISDAESGHRDGGDAFSVAVLREAFFEHALE